MTPLPTKQLRQHMQQRRMQLDKLTKKQVATQVCQHLVASPHFQTSTNIGCYVSIGAEIDTQQIIQAIHQQRKHCYLPVLRTKQRNIMDFFRYQRDAPLTPNEFGIPEPNQIQPNKILPQQLDLVLTPLVAVDKMGHRVGMGKGYYDRCFQFLLHQTRPRQPILLGLAYDFQQVAIIEPQSWDVPLDSVITESGQQFF